MRALIRKFNAWRRIETLKHTHLGCLMFLTEYHRNQGWTVVKPVWSAGMYYKIKMRRPL
jgi:hypothetical protein